MDWALVNKLINKGREDDAVELARHLVLTGLRSGKGRVLLSQEKTLNRLYPILLRKRGQVRPLIRLN